MGKFFWGFFFIYLNFNLSVNAHTLNVLPEFVGYFLLLQGLRELEEESGVFSDTRPFVVGMTVYTANFVGGRTAGRHRHRQLAEHTAEPCFHGGLPVHFLVYHPRRAGDGGAPSGGPQQRWHVPGLEGASGCRHCIICPDPGSSGGGGGCAGGSTCGHPFACGQPDAAGGLLARQEMLGSGSGGNDPCERRVTR